MIIWSCAGVLLVALSVIISYITVSFSGMTEPCCNACSLKAIEGHSYMFVSSGITRREKEGRGQHSISSVFSTSPRRFGVFFFLKYSFFVARIVLLSRMSDVCSRRTSRQGGAGSVRDGEQAQKNT